MSLDIWLEIDAGGNQPVEVGESCNITGNIHPQVVAGGADPWLYQGLFGSETLDELKACHKYLCDPANEAELRKMDPENGWGDLQASRDFVGALVALATMAPRARWMISK